MQAFCKTCNAIQTVELIDEGCKLVFCEVCGEEFNAVEDNSKFNNYRIARVVSVDRIQKQKDLKKVLVDSSGNGDTIQIVTNAKYIEPGWLVVVALEGAIVPARANIEEDTDAIQLKSTSVGGILSKGMLCDSPMLGWTGGAKGVVVQLPESYKIGDQPPESRPRIS